MEEVVPKITCQRGQTQDNPEEGKPDHADNIYRQCKKNLLHSILHRQEDKTGLHRSNEVGTAHSG